VTIKYYDNTRYNGPTYVGPCKYVSKPTHQTWISYTYYRLEADLKDYLDTSVLLSRNESIIFAPSWTNEYFLFLYNTVGKNHKWWYMNYESTEKLTEYLTSNKKQYMTLMDEGQPAGFAIIKHDIDKEKPANLEYFGLMPHAIGKGLGKKFLHDCLVYSNAKYMWLYTTSFDHPAARPAYQKAGFDIVERRNVSEYYPTEVIENEHS